MSAKQAFFSHSAVGKMFPVPRGPVEGAPAPNEAQDEGPHSPQPIKHGRSLAWENVLKGQEEGHVVFGEQERRPSVTEG